MPSTPSLAPHVTKIRSVVATKRAAIQSAFHEALYFSIRGPGQGEVATLLRFFLGLPKLEETMNSVLNPDQIMATIKGVFCHVSGKTGPIVDFSLPTGGRGCELCDLLVLVTYGSGSDLTLGNACFLQAKSERTDLNGGHSTDRQRELYELAPLFTFRKAANYSSTSLGENMAPGTREMPPKGTSGFCYWPFATVTPGAPNAGFYLNTSTVISPQLLGIPSDDLPFPDAMHDLMMGRLGLPVAAPVPGEFGWNRIVHDVVLRAMLETLRCSAGIADIKDINRMFEDAQQRSVGSFLSRKAALVANPFSELSGAFGSKDLDNLLSRISNTRRVTGEHLPALFAGSGDNEPPRRKQDGDEPDEGEGGAAFIQIHFTDNEESKHTTPRTRKISL